MKDVTEMKALQLRFMEDIKSVKSELAENRLKNQITGTVEIRDLKEVSQRQQKIEEQLTFLRDQFDRTDTPFALTIQEGDYEKRMRRLQLELENMATNIGGRFESRISSLESIQDNRINGLAQLLEGYETAQKEQFNLLQNKVYAFIDEQTNDILQKCTDHINETIVLHRRDMESMVKRLGTNI